MIILPTPSFAWSAAVITFGDLTSECRLLRTAVHTVIGLRKDCIGSLRRAAARAPGFRGRENQVYVKTREADLRALASRSFWKKHPGLVACDVSADARARVPILRFNDTINAVVFLMRMGRGQSTIRCQRAPGRVDTVLGYLHRAMRMQHAGVAADLANSIIEIAAASRDVSPACRNLLSPGTN
jgi:hypothetical protein